MTTNRMPASSVQNAVKAMITAAKPWPEVPKHVKLRKAHLPFWLDILHARARDEWSAVDLVVAAQLARCQGDIETEEQILAAEGRIITTSLGNIVANPRVSVLEQLARREMALMRALRMGGRIVGDSRDEANRRAIEQGAERAREELYDDEGLLAIR